MMKKLGILLIMIACSFAMPPKVNAQATELAQLALNVEKLAQFKQILNDMKSGYQIIEGGYNNIKSISEGNFKIHKAFLDGLMQVSPTVRKYRRVNDIISLQVRLVKEYNAASDRFRREGNFSQQELSYFSKVYQNLFKESLRNLNELAAVITAGHLRMTDDERIQAIDRIYISMQDKALFLKQFNNNADALGIQRSREKNDVNSMKTLHGLKH